MTGTYVAKKKSKCSIICAEYGPYESLSISHPGWRVAKLHGSKGGNCFFLYTNSSDCYTWEKTIGNCKKGDTWIFFKYIFIGFKKNIILKLFYIFFRSQSWRILKKVNSYNSFYDIWYTFMLKLQNLQMIIKNYRDTLDQSNLFYEASFEKLYLKKNAMYNSL